MSLPAVIQITRPLNTLIALASVLLGGWLGAGSLPALLFLAGISAALLTAGGNVLNDVHDLGIDRINKPGRPLPAGRLSLRRARVEGILLLSLGLSAGLLLPDRAKILAFLAAISLVLYNSHLKQTPLFGNLIVSGLGGLAFFYGGLAVENARPSLVPAGFALLYHLGREIFKDIEDAKGDRLRSGKTLPMRFGRKPALWTATGVFVLLITVSPLPVFFGLYGMVYLTLVFALDVFLAFALFCIWRNPGALPDLNHRLKYGMILGLLAIFLDRL